MAGRPLSAVEAVGRIMEICESLDPTVVWSVSDSRFTEGDSASPLASANAETDGEFVLTISCKPRRRPGPGQ